MIPEILRKEIEEKILVRNPLFDRFAPMRVGDVPYGTPVIDRMHPACRGMATGTPYVWCFACEAVHSSLPWREWVADT